MLIQALLVALVAGLAGIDLYVGQLHFHRPVVLGGIIGLIMGDFTTGLITGGTLELIWMGMVPLAGAQPPNVVVGGIIGTAFAIITKQDPKTAVGIAIPFAIAVQGLITLLFTIFSPMMQKVDKFAALGNYKGIEKINYFGAFNYFLVSAVVSFLPIYFGAGAASHVVSELPQWVLSGLAIAGGIMPAIGFAMLLKIMMKKDYIMFFIVGFILVAYLNLTTLAIALIGLAIALYDYSIHKSRTDEKVSESGDEISDGI